MPVIGTLLGKAIFGDDAFGRKPSVPTLPQLNPNQVQQDTIAGNLAATPSAQALASSVNAFNAGEQLAMLQRSMEFLAPGSHSKVQGILGDMLAGNIPKDVAAQVMRNSAAKSMAGGFAGSGLGRNLTARDLGLTSMDIIQRGLANLKNFAPNIPLFDMTAMFYTPQQRLQFAFQDREAHFAQQWRAEQVKAAPDPFAAAMTQSLIQDEAAILELAGSVVGMMGGGCWIARTVFGESDIRWRLFRMWLLTQAPVWFRNFYLTHGERLAKSIDRDTRALLFEPMNRIARAMAERYTTSKKGDQCPAI